MNKYQYTAIFEPALEGGYTVTVPALPGCISEGDSLETAKQNISEAMELYLDVFLEDHANPPTEVSAGALIERIDKGEKQILLVEHRDNTYVFPKGHIEPNESAEEAAKREIYEETGYSTTAISKNLGSIIRHSITPNGNIVFKTIQMFSATIDPKSNTGKHEEEYEWISVDKVSDKLRYKEDKKFFNDYLAQQPIDTISL